MRLLRRSGAPNRTQPRSARQRLHNIGQRSFLCLQAAGLQQFPEQGDAQSIFDNPQHPYTRELLQASSLKTQETALADVV